MEKEQFSLSSIIPSILLVVLLMIVYPLTDHIFSFVQSPTLSLLLAGLLRLTLLVFVIVVVIRKGYIDIKQFQIKPISWSIILLALLTMYLSSILPTSLISLSYIEESSQLALVQNLVNQSDIYTFLYMCIIAPIVEEILFRGIILGGLLKRHSFIFSLLVSSLLFGFLHVTIIGSIIFALILGWVYYRTRNLLYPILMHASFNFIGFVLRYYMKNNQLSIMELSNRFPEFSGFNIWSEVIITILFIICIIGLHKLLKKKSFNEKQTDVVD